MRGLVVGDAYNNRAIRTMNTAARCAIVLVPIKRVSLLLLVDLVEQALKILAVLRVKLD